MNGDKNFEIRFNDFICNKGDILILKEWNPKIKKYTGRIIEKEVKIVSRLNNLNFWSKEDIDKYGYQVIGF